MELISTELELKRLNDRKTEIENWFRYHDNAYSEVVLREEYRRLVYKIDNIQKAHKQLQS